MSQRPPGHVVDLLWVDLSIVHSHKSRGIPFSRSIEFVLSLCFIVCLFQSCFTLLLDTCQFK